jgi:hypothetical protein
MLHYATVQPAALRHQHTALTLLQHSTAHSNPHHKPSPPPPHTHTTTTTTISLLLPQPLTPQAW